MLLDVRCHTLVGKFFHNWTFFPNFAPWFAFWNSPLWICYHHNQLQSICSWNYFRNRTLKNHKERGRGFLTSTTCCHCCQTLKLNPIKWAVIIANPWPPPSAPLPCSVTHTNPVALTPDLCSSFTHTHNFHSSWINEMFNLFNKCFLKTRKYKREENQQQKSIMVIKV